MKKRNIFCLLTALLLLIPKLTPAYALAQTISYPATGGSFQYNTERHAVTGSDPAVSSVDIPYLLHVRDYAGSYTLPVQAISRNWNTGRGAFEEKPGLTSAALGEGVKTVEQKAFQKAENLVGLSLPSSIDEISSTAFSGCVGLRELTIPEGVGGLQIMSNAFQNCTSLERVYFLSQNCVIAPDAFQGAKKLTVYGYPGSTAEAFAKGKALPFVSLLERDDRFVARKDGLLIEYHGGESVIDVPPVVGGVPVTGIADGLFQNSRAVQRITLPEGVRTIGKEAFSGCSELKAVSLPASLTEIQENAFSNCGNLKELDLPSGLTVIGAGAFLACSGLTSLELPSSLREIGDRAFISCTGLTELRIPGREIELGRAAFSLCSGLTRVTLEEGLTSIGSGMFNGCTGLTEILIPSSVKMIADGAFRGCTSLEKAVIPGAETRLADEKIFEGCLSLVIYGVADSSAELNAGGHDFQAIADAHEAEFQIDSKTGLITGYSGAGGYIVLPQLVGGVMVTGIAPGAFSENQTITEITFHDGVRSVGQGAFQGCSALVRLDWPRQVSVVPDAAFRGCHMLRYIGLPETVTAIGTEAFSGCGGLEELKLPSSLREIGDRAFSGTSISEIILPDSLTKLGSGAFSDCKALSGLSVPATVSYLGAGAFQGCVNLEQIQLVSDFAALPARLFDGCVKLRRLTVQPGVTTLGERTFADCQSLFEYPHWESLRVIGPEAFQNSGLTAANLPDGLSEIQNQAFAGCRALRSVTLPEGLSVLGEGAFSGSGLTSAVLPERLPLIPARAFAECGGLTLTVPGLDTILSDTAFQDGKNITVRCFEESAIYRQINELPPETLIFTESLTPPPAPAEGFQVQNGWIVRYIGTLEGPLTIASEIDGQQITGVGAYAFLDQTGITSLSLPEGVTAIGTGAFSGCAALTGLEELPSSLSSIGAEAFSGCPLGRLELGAHISWIGDGAFRDCKDLTIVCRTDSAAFGYARRSGVPYEAETVDLSVRVSGDGNTYTVQNQFSDREIILVFGAYTESDEVLSYQLGAAGAGTSCTFSPHVLRVADHVKVYAWDRMSTIRPVASLFLHKLGDIEVEG